LSAGYIPGKNLRKRFGVAPRSGINRNTHGMQSEDMTNKESQMNKNRNYGMVLVVMLMFAFSAFGTGCTKYKLKIQSQHDEIKALKKDKKQLEKDNEELKGLNAELAEAKQGLEETKAALEATIEKLNEQIKGLEEDLANQKLGKEQLAGKLKNKEKLLKELLKKERAAKKRLATFKKILKQFKSLIKSGKLNVKIRRGKMVLELPSAILFESGKANLSDDGKQTLAEVAKVLVTIRKREFQVSGHTDNVPIKTSNFASNWELSTARAVTVVKFLQSKNMNPKNLSAAGYSEYQPAATNKTDKGKALNRRIEIVLMPNLDELPDLSDLEKELAK
jgi:chemotaxis protein MotB